MLLRNRFDEKKKKLDSYNEFKFKSVLNEFKTSVCVCDKVCKTYLIDCSIINHTKCHTQHLLCRTIRIKWTLFSTCCCFSICRLNECSSLKLCDHEVAEVCLIDYMNFIVFYRCIHKTLLLYFIVLFCFSCSNTCVHVIWWQLSHAVYTDSWLNHSNHLWKYITPIRLEIENWITFMYQLNRDIVIIFNLITSK